MRRLKEILSGAIEKRASDIHLTVGAVPIYRIDGKLTPHREKSLRPEDTEAFARSILTKELFNQLEKEREIDTSYEIADLSRFRVNIFYQRGSLSLAFRVISKKIPQLDDLALPEIIKEIVTQPHGLILVTGPTGSGKSTTLAAMIDYMNREINKHIITLEDPIEYIHQHNQSIIDQRQIGFDATSFKSGLRAALRQDPDVIMVGEMRDLETIATAITAAETGQLVLATLHTQDASSTMDRVIDVFPSHQKDQIRLLLSNVLGAIISQRLFPLAQGKGRITTTEVLVNNTAVKNLIRNEKMHQIPNVLQTSRSQGMHTMEMDIREKVSKGLINPALANPYLTNLTY